MSFNLGKYIFLTVCLLLSLRTEKMIRKNEFIWDNFLAEITEWEQFMPSGETL